MIEIACANPGCAEVGVAKSVDERSSVRSPVYCGECGVQFVSAELDALPPVDPTQSAGSFGPTIASRLEALERFQADLIAALSSIFSPADPATGDQFAALMGRETPAPKTKRRGQ
jgi:hypothetical protein